METKDQALREAKASNKYNPSNMVFQIEALDGNKPWFVIFDNDKQLKSHVDEHQGKGFSYTLIPQH